VKKIAIFGTSGMATEVGDIAVELDYQPIFVARDKVELDAWNQPYDVILESEMNRYHGMPASIGIGENAVREKVAKRFAGILQFENLIHPSASFGLGQREKISSKQGVIVSAGVRFTNNIEVGDFTIFNLNATISHDVIIEDFVCLAPGAHICGNVHLRKRCWIGAGAVVNQGGNEAKIMIGSDTVVGSGSVVVKSCEKNGVYIGIPARKIK
tara:strand:- start:1306 stop:1941 length:636 start_codon:yes stop_codon:yes gene_type:complete